MKGRFYFLTWLYSVVLNTILVAVMVLGTGPSYLSFGERISYTLQQIASIGVFTIPFSMPGLLALMLAPGATRFFTDARQRFTIIILFCLLGTFTGYLLMWVALGINPFDILVLPGVAISIASVLAALFINRRLFNRTFTPGYKKRLADINNG